MKVVYHPLSRAAASAPPLRVFPCSAASCVKLIFFNQQGFFTPGYFTLINTLKAGVQQIFVYFHLAVRVFVVTKCSIPKFSP